MGTPRPDCSGSRSSSGTSHDRHHGRAGRALFAFFRYTRMGLAMRAAAYDQEAALAQGVSVGWSSRCPGRSPARSPPSPASSRPPAAAWISTVDHRAGRPAGDHPRWTGLAARRGRRRPAVGVVRSPWSPSTSGLRPVVGRQRLDLTPYLLMLVVLLVRPYGLFGTREVEPYDDVACERRFGRPELYTSYSRRWRCSTPAQEGDGGRCCSCWRWPCRSRSRPGSAAARHRRASLAIGAIGLGLVTGYAGQVRWATRSSSPSAPIPPRCYQRRPGRPRARLRHQEVLVWLPAAGRSSALAGTLVAPLATRLRGLYLAIVTLGLVFIGAVRLREWTEITGGRTSAGRRRCRPLRQPSRRRRTVVHPRPEALLADAGAAGDLRAGRPQHRPIPGRAGPSPPFATATSPPA